MEEQRKPKIPQQFGVFAFYLLLCYRPAFQN